MIKRIKKIVAILEEQLNQVYGIIEQLSDSENMVKKPSLMSKLRKIKIDAPEDFSIQVSVSLGRDISEE
ncbi:MAG: hypothetical protein HEQ10_12290 [Dolichospermum sp. DEX182a]|nr:hypothetical protein [Dolichospermum sp. DEX182a]QSV64321.1 MAG: hypothetical protein HEQ26_17790 [Dolichospermum sp. DL01]